MINLLQIADLKFGPCGPLVGVPAAEVEVDVPLVGVGDEVDG